MTLSEILMSLKGVDGGVGLVEELEAWVSDLSIMQVISNPDHQDTSSEHPGQSRARLD